MEPRTPISFRLRAAFFFAVAFTVLLGGYFLASYLSIQGTITTRSDTEIYAALDSILAHLKKSPTAATLDETAHTYATTGEASIAVKLVRTDNPTFSLAAHGPKRITAILDSGTFHSPDLPRTIRAGSLSIRILGRSSEHFLLLGAIDTLPFHEVEETMLSRFLILLGTGLVVSFVTGFFTANLALKPLNVLIASASAIKSDPTPELRLPTATHTQEINELALMINDILSERDHHISALRNFTADAAHELRTPLTILKGELEVDLRTRTLSESERAAIESNLEEVHRLIRIVEDLLSLARLEREPRQRSAITESWILEDLLAECISRLGLMATEKNITITSVIPSETPLTIPREDIRTILSNIIDNAIRYTPNGGRVDISIAREPDGSICVDVKDSGIGIGAEDLPHIFDRFWRADRSRTRAAGGTGLGLTISKTLADLHRLTIEVSSNAGEGTLVRCHIPT